LDSSFPLLKAAYKCTKNLYEDKQPSWYGSVQHILQNMPSLNNFLSDKQFALIYQNEEGTGLVLTVLQSWCFF
jgi:hypothetical protein